MQFQKSYTLLELSQYLGGTVTRDEKLVLHGISTLKEASATEITFLMNPQYLPFVSETKAAAIVTTHQYVDKCLLPTILVNDAHVAFARLMQLCEKSSVIKTGIHPNATVHPRASIADSAYVDAYAVIGEDAVVGDEAYIGPHVVIGDRTQIGPQTKLNANVSIYQDVTIGARCILHSGVVIGADGFGFANDKGTWVKIPQLAGVEIGDDVEIGANTAIDRGVLSPTRIGKGVKIDNLVQIGHNVQIGDHTIITGCVAIAGSTTIGKHCAIGGGSCINGHIHITDGVQITAMSGVLGNIEKPGIYSGAPAIENAQWRKNLVSYLRLPEILKRLRTLERGT